SSCLVVALPFRSLPFRLVFRIWDLGVAWVYGILPFKGGAPKGRRVRAAEHNILHEPGKSVVLGRAHPRRFATVPWEGTHQRFGADIQTVSKSQILNGKQRGRKRRQVASASLLFCLSLRIQDLGFPSERYCCADAVVDLVDVVAAQLGGGLGDAQGVGEAEGAQVERVLQLQPDAEAL